MVQPDAAEGDGLGSTPTTADEVEALGVSLGPALHEACGDRLGWIEWFRSPWQRSGAATGRTWWRLPDGRMIAAIVKVPVGYGEWLWTTSLGGADPMLWDAPGAARPPVPRVLASGLELGGYDVAWVVLERVEGPTVAQTLHRDALDALFHAAAEFHAAAADIRPPTRDARPTPPNWSRLLARAHEACEVNPLPDAPRWRRAIAAVTEHLPRLTAVWEARPIDAWCHGDLHPGNVILTGERAVLIDLGLVHAGCWVEDALYLERLYWGREEMLGGVRPMSRLAMWRERHGLRNGEDPPRYARVRRALMAATSPAFLHQEGDPRYLAAALEHAERDLADTLAAELPEAGGGENTLV